MNLFSSDDDWTLQTPMHSDFGDGNGNLHGGGYGNGAAFGGGTYGDGFGDGIDTGSITGNGGGTGDCGSVSGGGYTNGQLEYCPPTHLRISSDLYHHLLAMRIGVLL